MYKLHFMFVDLPMLAEVQKYEIQMSHDKSILNKKLLCFPYNLNICEGWQILKIHPKARHKPFKKMY